MKNLCLLILSLFAFASNVTAQSIQQIDSLTMKMCDGLVELSDIKPHLQISIVFQKHLPGFFEKSKISSQQAADSIADLIYFRMQKNCHRFREVLDKTEENKSDWKTLTAKPESELSAKQLKKFFEGKNYYYKEFDGKIVNLEISPDSWSETFEDNTTSKLILHRLDNNEFELEFVESNNKTRKNLSVAGERYHYGVYAFNKGAYSVWVISGEGAIYGFRLYPKK